MRNSDNKLYLGRVCKFVCAKLHSKGFIICVLIVSYILQAFNFFLSLLVTQHLHTFIYFLKVELNSFCFKFPFSITNNCFFEIKTIKWKINPNANNFYFVYIDAGKKFGVTDFINPSSCGEKSVSQVISVLISLQKQ